jgi:hypothetical protein
MSPTPKCTVSELIELVENGEYSALDQELLRLAQEELDQVWLCTYYLKEQARFHLSARYHVQKRA